MIINITVIGLILLSLVSYASGGILLFLGNKKGGILAALGVAANFSLFVLNWILMREPPFGNMYHVLIVLALTFIPIYFILTFREDQFKWLLPYFVILSAIPMMGVLFMEKQFIWERSPALQSPWFIPHIASYMIAYAMNITGFFLVVVSCFVKADKEKFSDAVYKLIKFGFPFMTIGLLFGAIWAEDAWGTYWSWDVKESWSLIMWIFNIVYLHVRYDQRFKKYANIFVICSLISLIVTFLLVNYLPQLSSALHGYV